MKPPHSLTDDELLKYIDEHVEYELDMLVWSAGILARLAPHKTDGYLPWALNNGLLNSFAVHARNLIAFLYPSSVGKGFPTDVVIGDFVPHDVLSEHQPAISSILEEAIVKSNKQVAHLSLERLQYEAAGKEWKFIDVARDIKKALAAITPHIPSARISHQLREKFTDPKLAIPFVDVTVLKTADAKSIGVTLALRPSTTTPTGSA